MIDFGTVAKVILSVTFSSLALNVTLSYIDDYIKTKRKPPLSDYMFIVGMYHISIICFIDLIKVSYLQ